MKKKNMRIMVIPQDRKGAEEDLNKNKEFLYRIRMSLLAALAEGEMITGYRYELCLEEIRKTKGNDPV